MKKVLIPFTPITLAAVSLYLISIIIGCSTIEKEYDIDHLVIRNNVFYERFNEKNINGRVYKIYDVETHQTLGFVANDYPNSGNYLWTIPDTLLLNNEYKLWIEDAAEPPIMTNPNENDPYFILTLNDCSGVCNGEAVDDECGDCNGPTAFTFENGESCIPGENITTGLCTDENGYCNCGEEEYDCAGMCGGSTEVDCAGVCGGNAYYDNCDTCDNDSSNDCAQDCMGVWGGNLEPDCCGVCGGDNSQCSSCCGSPLYEDCTDDCAIDINGVCCYELEVDACGECGGDGDGTDCNDDGIPDDCEEIYTAGLEEGILLGGQSGDANGDGTLDILDIVYFIDVILYP